jgi:hypothetical protein
MAVGDGWQRFVVVGVEVPHAMTPTTEQGHECARRALALHRGLTLIGLTCSATVLRRFVRGSGRWGASPPEGRTFVCPHCGARYSVTIRGCPGVTAALQNVSSASKSWTSGIQPRTRYTNSFTSLRMPDRPPARQLNAPRALTEDTPAGRPTPFPARCNRPIKAPLLRRRVIEPESALCQTVGTCPSGRTGPARRGCGLSRKSGLEWNGCIPNDGHLEQ